MSYELDPHHVIAMLHMAYLNQADTFPRFLDIAHYAHECGITDNLGIHRRTFPILDAIASLSINKKQHQVVAVALQLDSEKQMVRLTIAENHEVEDQLVKHITNIWEKLQTLSDRYAVVRKPRDCRENSPEIPAGVETPLRLEIFRDMCLFSLNKHMTRVRKWGNKFRLFMRGFIKSRRGIDLDEFEQNLYDVGAALLYLTSSLADLGANPEKQLTMDQWKKMFYESLVVSKVIGAVLADRHSIGCEALANELQGILFCSIYCTNLNGRKIC